MATLELQKETRVNSHGFLSFSCSVTLNDYEQILIDIEEHEWKMVNDLYKQVPTGVIKKARLEGIYYHNNEGLFSIHSLNVRGFRKDGQLRYRDENVYNITQKMIDQIPDEYHNYAREHFVIETTKVQEELTTMINKGVQIVTK